MLSRLTQGLRWRWARALAVAYLLCALAPGLAFAFGDGVAARCALAGAHTVAANASKAGDTHAHHDRAQHMHDGSAHAMAGDAAKHSHGAGKSGTSDKADQMCCGLACVSALPAGLLSVSLPDLVAATEMPLPEQALAALTPARLYKPPIAAMSF